MRKKQIFQGLFLLLLLALDFVFQALFDASPLLTVGFTSQLHFLGLLLLTNDDTRFDITLKVILIGIIMDLFHYNSFPIYHVSYGLAAIIIRIWYRHIGSTFVETMVLMGTGLFLKEIFLFISLWIFKGMHYSFVDFVATRSLWIVIGNLILFPIAYRLYNILKNKIEESPKHRY